MSSLRRSSGFRSVADSSVPNPYQFKDGAAAFNFGLLVGYLREALDGTTMQAQPTIDAEGNYLAILRFEKSANQNGPEQAWMLGLVRE